MTRQTYPSDITDEEWAILEPLIPIAKKGGRPRKVDTREIVNAIFYVLRSGCAWRMLPHDFPPWSTVYTYFRNWKNDSVIEAIHDTLRGLVRLKVGKNEEASAGIIDSQSVKTTEKGGYMAMMQVKKLMGVRDIF